MCLVVRLLRLRIAARGLAAGWLVSSIGAHMHTLFKIRFVFDLILATNFICAPAHLFVHLNTSAGFRCWLARMRTRARAPTARLSRWLNAI